jgi:hypothetical protein
MKTSFTAAVCLLVLIAFSVISCKKEEETPGAKDQLIKGEWVINRIQQKVYSGSTLVKDTIFRQNPRPINLVRFNEGAAFEYKFNTSTSQTGSYQLVGNDSVICAAGSTTYRWKMITLVKRLFTTENTSTSNPTYPGYTVKTYYTFIK